VNNSGQLLNAIEQMITLLHCRRILSILGVWSRRRDNSTNSIDATIDFAE
jgi:hypothetical protein